MVNALVLYTTGLYEEVKVESDDIERLQEYVNGGVGMIPTALFTNHETNETSKLLCFANEEGPLKNLPINPWAGFLSSFGVSLTFNLFLHGNIVLFAEDGNGEEVSIKPFFIELVKEYNECEDRDLFFAKLDELFKLKVNVSKKRKRIEEEEEKNKVYPTTSSLKKRVRREDTVV